MAQNAFLNKYHFIRSFKAEAGLTPHQFQIQNRIRKAQLSELLVSGGYLAAFVVGKMLFPSAVASTARMEWGICVSNTLILCP